MPTTNMLSKSLVLGWSVVFLGCLLSSTHGAGLREQFDVLPEPLLVEGDIAVVVLPWTKFASFDDEGRFIAMSVRNGSIGRKWPNNKSPYEFSPFFTDSERRIILTGMAEINGNTTHLKIAPRTNEVNYVYISRGPPDSGCYSYVGNNKIGRQILNLEAPGCMAHDVVVHHLGHSLGLYHEQARTDRDGYVEINWPNIAERQHEYFQKYDATFVTEFPVPYDIHSQMHFLRREFAIERNGPNGWATRPVAPNQHLDVGQLIGLSALDIVKINAMYGNSDPRRARKTEPDVPVPGNLTYLDV